MATILTTRSTNRIVQLAMLLCACSMLWGCSKPAVVEGVMAVEISGKTFQLDIVADNESRTVGLGGRKSMGADEGMLFSFPDAKVRRFLMRDCVFDIDIIFLDAAGRITAMHAMPVEPPRAEDESLTMYERRLPTYSSRYSAKYAIELVGGMLETLDLKEGQRIEMDIQRLEAITQ